MIRVSLPGIVELHCPLDGCGGSFSIGSRSLHERRLIYCPFCGQEFEIYAGLSGQLRRRFYHAIRDHIERRVYEQQQIDRDDYFEDRSNLI